MKNLFRTFMVASVVTAVLPIGGCAVDANKPWSPSANRAETSSKYCYSTQKRFPYQASRDCQKGDLKISEEVYARHMQDVVGKPSSVTPTVQQTTSHSTQTPTTKVARTLTAASANAVTNPDAVAVIIGNKVYQGGIPAVDFAHNDAEAIKRYVLDVLGYDPENIIDLRDASKAEMEAAFGNKGNFKGRLWQYLDPDGGSDIMVYYSGHGVPGQNDQRSYMLPANADPAFAEINGYPVDVLYENLNKLNGRSKTVLIDACFSGASPKGMLIDMASPVSIKAKAIGVGQGMTVLTAASGDQLASWDTEAKLGLFTNYFLEAVYGKADGNSDGNVTAAEIKGYLDDKMTRAARRSYRRIQQATLSGDSEQSLSSFTKGSPPQRPFIDDQPVEEQVASLPPAKADFKVSDLDEEMVAKKKSNVRSQPTIDADIIASLARGEAISVTGWTTLNGSDWYRVVLTGGRDGYVLGTGLIPPYREPDSEPAQVFSPSPPPPLHRPGVRLPPLFNPRKPPPRRRP
ncbi:MAG: caspase family protein [Rhodospirillales bacterium]|nr:caspase family protein [Rhodospirillales bacterium]